MSQLFKYVPRNLWHLTLHFALVNLKVAIHLQLVCHTFHVTLSHIVASLVCHTLHERKNEKDSGGKAKYAISSHVLFRFFTNHSLNCTCHLSFTFFFLLFFFLHCHCKIWFYCYKAPSCN
jgi:hypothetical protein